MSCLQENVEGSIMAYDFLIEQNILIEKILIKEQLQILDCLILDHVDGTQWQTITTVIKKVLIALEKNEQLYFFAPYNDYSELLINQRIAYLEKMYRIKVNGNVKSMELSEIITFSEDLMLLDQTLYLFRVYNNEDKTLSFNMADIISSGLKEQLRLRGEEINDNYIKEQTLALLQEQKNQENLQTHDYGMGHHLKEGLYHLKQHINYGNKQLEPIYHYLNDIVENHQQYMPNIKILCEAFPIEHTITLPHTLSIKNKEYTLNKIMQKHKTSCAIACISMITGVDYGTVLKKTKELFNWPKNRAKFGLTMDKIQTLLSYYGISHQLESQQKSWKDCSDLAICQIDLDISGNTSHAVVFFRHQGKDYVLDPGVENPVRIDFYNMRLESVINIG